MRGERPAVPIYSLCIPLSQHATHSRPPHQPPRTAHLSTVFGIRKNADIRCSSAASRHTTSPDAFRQQSAHARRPNMRLLFTHPSEPAALALGRLLAAEGHAIHAVEDEYIWGTAPARYCRSYTRFHRLNPTTSLTDLWKTLKHHIDVIILFGSISRYDRQILGAEGTRIIGDDLFNNEHEFQSFLRIKVIGALERTTNAVKVPSVFEIHSRACIAEILGHYPSTAFRLYRAPNQIRDEEEGDDEDAKTLVDVETHSASISFELCSNGEPLVFSYDTLDDDVVKEIKCLPISEECPYRLVEAVEGGTLYFSHVLVIDGEVRTFTVTTGLANRPEIISISSSQLIFRALFRFTLDTIDALVRWRRDDATIEETAFKHKFGFSTHLSISFRVKDEIRPDGHLVRKITAVSCSTKPHTSLILPCNAASLRHRLAHIYIHPSGYNDSTKILMLPTSNTLLGIYSFHSTFRILRQIIVSFQPSRFIYWTRLARWILLILVWALCFQEEIWSWSDPGPAMCLWLKTGLGWLGLHRNSTNMPVSNPDRRRRTASSRGNLARNTTPQNGVSASRHAQIQRNYEEEQDDLGISSFGSFNIGHEYTLGRSDSTKSAPGRLCTTPVERSEPSRGGNAINRDQEIAVIRVLVSPLNSHRISFSSDQYIHSPPRSSSPDSASSPASGDEEDSPTGHQDSMTGYPDLARNGSIRRSNGRREQMDLATISSPDEDVTRETTPAAKVLDEETVPLDESPQDAVMGSPVVRDLCPDMYHGLLEQRGPLRITNVGSCDLSSSSEDEESEGEDEDNDADDSNDSDDDSLSGITLVNDDEDLGDDETVDVASNREASTPIVGEEGVEAEESPYARPLSTLALFAIGRVLIGTLHAGTIVVWRILLTATYILRCVRLMVESRQYLLLCLYLQGIILTLLDEF
ncbi:unnamed protein product [Periconia digitata]|uniref:Uncharacterized protein n=1 Tax=Periconia digitata TaxID=1303443 RepID=A0A9W4UV71_9PLEO|nr:unnamed protein product [Periconia digitata]